MEVSNTVQWLIIASNRIKHVFELSLMHHACCKPRRSRHSLAFTSEVALIMCFMSRRYQSSGVYATGWSERHLLVEMCNNGHRASRGRGQERSHPLLTPCQSLTRYGSLQLHCGTSYGYSQTNTTGRNPQCRICSLNNFMSIVLQSLMQQVGILCPKNKKLSQSASQLAQRP